MVIVAILRLGVVARGRRFGPGSGIPSAERAGVLNVFIPGGFEVMMPAIVDYFD